jgi:hypothetical protein
MKRTYFSLAVVTGLALIMTACGGSKKTAAGVRGEVEIVMPCSGVEYQSDKDFFRAMIPAVSNNMGAAKTQALALARAELATQVNALVKSVSETYQNSYTSGEQNDTKIKMDAITRIVVSERISGSRLICEKMLQMPDKQYRCYVAVELSIADLRESMEAKIKQDEKLRNDFEQEKFREIFNEEMDKLPVL